MAPNWKEKQMEVCWKLNGTTLYADETTRDCTSRTDPPVTYFSVNCTSCSATNGATFSVWQRKFKIIFIFLGYSIQWDQKCFRLQDDTSRQNASTNIWHETLRRPLFLLNTSGLKLYFLSYLQKLYIYKWFS